MLDFYDLQLKWGISMSVTRKKYIVRLIVRFLILLLSIAGYLLKPEAFDILEGMNFFSGFSVLHILWAVWVFDMIQQIIPIKNKLPLGSMKLFASRFCPIREKINHEALRSYIVTTTKAAYKVFILWCGLLAVIGVLYNSGILNNPTLF